MIFSSIGAFACALTVAVAPVATDGTADDPAARSETTTGEKTWALVAQVVAPEDSRVGFGLERRVSKSHWLTVAGNLSFAMRLTDPSDELLRRVGISLGDRIEIGSYSGVRLSVWFLLHLNQNHIQYEVRPPTDVASDTENWWGSLGTSFAFAADYDLAEKLAVRLASRLVSVGYVNDWERPEAVLEEEKITFSMGVEPSVSVLLRW